MGWLGTMKEEDMVLGQQRPRRLEAWYPKGTAAQT